MDLLNRIKKGLGLQVRANGTAIARDKYLEYGAASWRGDVYAQVQYYRQWVYVAVRAIANRVAGTPLRFFYEDGQERVELDHPIRKLFAEVNPFDTSVSLWMRTMIYLELTGNAYWYAPRNTFGQIVEIWLLPSQYMKVIADKEKFIGGFEYSYGGMTETFTAAEIIHLKYPSPESVYYGVGPLQAAADSVEAHALMKRAERYSFAHGAFPGLAIQTDEKLSPAVRKRLEDAFESGFAGADKAGRTLILEQGLKVRPFTLSPREMDFLQSSKMTRDEILAVFGVPAAVAGISEDVNRASAEAMLYTFSENTILPKLRLIEAQITQDICSAFSQNIVARFDSPVPQSREEDRADMELRLKYGLTTADEERARLAY